MKTMVPPWTLAMVALLAAQTVVGFGVFDVLRASRQIKDSRRDVMAPADALVHVVLEQLDMDGDQQITLEEIGRYFALLREEESLTPPYWEKGYIITLATFLDADQSGIVELDELQRAVTVLVTNSGTKFIGWFIGDLALSDFSSKRFDPVLKAGEIAGDFLAALDTDNDGLVSTEAGDTPLANQLLKWDVETYRARMDDVDQNNDGNLDQSETSLLLRGLTESDIGLFRFMFIYMYTRVWKMAGAEIASEWLNPS